MVFGNCAVQIRSTSLRKVDGPLADGGFSSAVESRRWMEFAGAITPIKYRCNSQLRP